MLTFTDSCRFSNCGARFATAFSAGLLATLATVITPPVAAQPLISGTAGTGTNSYFFAVDFRDFAAPQSYAFEYRSNSTSLFFADVLQGLAAVPTFSTRLGDGGAFGLSLNGIAFSGKEKFNDFGGNNSGEPNGFWSQWRSPDAVNWTPTEFGISSQTVAAGQWVGASWVGDFNTGTGTAPRVPSAVSSAAPEPGTLGLLAFGMIVGAGAVRRRKTAGRRSAAAPV